jgi:hypothetical protein
MYPQYNDIMIIKSILKRMKERRQRGRREGGREEGRKESSFRTPHCLGVLLAT